MKKWWKSRFLLIDRLMYGSFIRKLSIIVAGTLIIFTILSIVGLFLPPRLVADSSFRPGWDTFLYMSNPDIAEYSRLSERLYVIITNIFGMIAINGLIITLLVNWVLNRQDRFTNGTARYKHIKESRFAVIIGGHKMVAKLANDILTDKKKKLEYVIIQTQRPPENLRREISACIEDKKLAANVIIYAGDRTAPHELRELYLNYAEEVYIIGELPTVDGSSHDAINMQCWNEITNIKGEKREGKIPCHIMFEYQSTFNAFQFTDINVERSQVFRFIPFSIYETWAQQVLVQNPYESKKPFIPLEGNDGLSYDSRQRVHLIIIGMSKMGMALALEAAHVAHYPNFNNHEAGRPRTLITFIDRNAEREMYLFTGRYRELFKLARWRYVKAPKGVVDSKPSWKIYDSITDIESDNNHCYPWNKPQTDKSFNSPYYGNYLGDDFIDIDFEFIEGEMSLPSIQQYITDACADKADSNINLYDDNHRKYTATSKTTIAVCLPIAAEAMSIALYFNPSVYKDAQQIIVQQQESGSLVDAVSAGIAGSVSDNYRVLRPFGMIDKCCYLNNSDMWLAKFVAYAYKCIGDGKPFDKKYADRKSDMDFINDVEECWKSISPENGKSTISQRWSNLYCANSFFAKINSTLHKNSSNKIELPISGLINDTKLKSILAKTEHNRWVIEQLLLGMRPIDNKYPSPLPITDKSEKSRLKSLGIHPNLASNDKLGVDSVYDEGIVEIIPLALRIAASLDGKKLIYDVAPQA